MGVGVTTKFKLIPENLVKLNFQAGVTTSSNISTTPAVVALASDWNGLQALVEELS